MGRSRPPSETGSTRELLRADDRVRHWHGEPALRLFKVHLARGYSERTSPAKVGLYGNIPCDLFSPTFWTVPLKAWPDLLVKSRAPKGKVKAISLDAVPVRAETTNFQKPCVIEASKSPGRLYAPLVSINECLVFVML